MDLEGVVPVAVPIEPGHPTRITIPRNTHIMYWCVLHPSPYPPFDRNESLIERELLEFERRLQRKSSLELRVNGDTVPLLDDTRPDYGIEYWTVNEPLPEGTHTVEVSITYESEQSEESYDEHRTQLPEWAPPPTYSLPSNAMIPWGDGSESTIQSELIVTDMPSARLETETDPLWDRKEIFSPIDREEYSPEE